MKKVITYGTFDLFHDGHRKLLQRARMQGDYLIVGVTTDNYDKYRGKLNVKQSLMERIENVKKSGLADKIIIEEFEGQKVKDVIKYDVNTFVIGSDWYGKFDFLNKYCNVVYLERTAGISSTQIRESNNSIIKLGIIGNGRIAQRFVNESKFVSGISVEGVYGRSEKNVKSFCEKNELVFFATDLDEFFSKVDAVYIATPHNTHFEFAELSLLSRKHVLCEKPITLSVGDYDKLVEIAKRENLIYIEGIKTAYCPGFENLLAIVNSGIIGDVKNIDASFTKLISGDCRELDSSLNGGSVTELASYPLLVFVKLLGYKYKKCEFVSHFNENSVDLFTKINLIYDSCVATAKVGLGVKSEGDLIISGTIGYIYVPAPWWKTEFFEIKFENSDLNEKRFYKFFGDGLRYEISEFINLINDKSRKNIFLSLEDSREIIKIIEKFINKNDVYKI